MNFLSALYEFSNVMVDGEPKETSQKKVLRLSVEPDFGPERIPT
jgi:hypothetical protein